MQRPTGVTILAILCFLGAALLVIASLAFFMMGGALLSGGGGMGAMVAGLGAIGGVVMLLFAALYVAVGVGLWKLLNWARILAIVLVAIGLVFVVLGLLGSFAHFAIGRVLWNVIWAAIDVWIITYLIRPNVRQAFSA